MIHGILERKSRYTIGRRDKIQMTLNEFACIVKNNEGLIAVCVVAIMSILEVSKIKINPWSWISNFLNKGVLEKMDKIENDVSEVKREVAESSAVTSRYRILRFDDEILHGTRHTKEHFDQILLDIDVYENFCEEHPDFKNNLAVMAIQHIKEVYTKCSQDKSFL